MPVSATATGTRAVTAVPQACGALIPVVPRAVWEGNWASLGVQASVGVAERSERSSSASRRGRYGIDMTSVWGGAGAPAHGTTAVDRILIIGGNERHARGGQVGRSLHSPVVYARR